jgi:hypothetical protein
MEVIGLDKKALWDEIIRSMSCFDFYHTADYSALDDAGTQFLIYCEYGENAFALPVVLRNIAGTDFRDITSVYGYAGPLVKGKNFEPDVLRFQKDIKSLFDQWATVSVFARLHPLLDFQEKILENFGEVTETGTVVCIDLRLSEEEQWRQYSRSLKNIVNRLRNDDRWTVRPYCSQADISLFTTLYHENMQRVKAEKMYFFDDNYFTFFLKNIPSNLYLACFDGNAVAGTLFTECNGIIQTHLSATCKEFLPLSPLKYVRDEIRRYGVSKGLSFMNMGGGVGGERDSLFDFKAQFSQFRLPFKTWRYIHNTGVYEELTNLRFNGKIQPSGYFPLYRL